MRFIEGGPSIPDELLTARDEGRVVIFCGAGVSRAKAGIPDFISLAEAVADSLGVSSADPIRAVLKEISTLGQRTGVNGLISADVVFDRLEQSFERSDIDRAVAEALIPIDGVDLSAHQMLIDLARTPSGNVRVVTSNFERLFEACAPDLTVYTPLNLPDVSRVDDFNGIVHNHGIVNELYTDSAGDGFILSSSEFGKAYLADGWATKFIRSILDKYVVLFIGYAADDPPVKYLLQGINRLGNNKNTLYAFHAGTAGEADASWSTKGVEAIAYNPDDHHHFLWETIEAWRNRAIDIDGWYEQQFKLADQGPEKLSRHQRGKIAHIVSTRIGAKKLAQREMPIPATWLCVFDSVIRFSKPGKHGDDFYNYEWVDPFELYGIDDDVEPKKIDPEDVNSKREIPSGAWDAFRVFEKELIGNVENSVSTLYGYHAVKPASLPERLSSLGSWMAKVADQPALLWWAGRKTGLHPDIQWQIRNTIDGRKSTIDSVVRAGWEYMFDVWDNIKPAYDFGWYELKDTVGKYGWSQTIVRRFADITKPYYTVRFSYRNFKPPENFDGNINQLISREVNYLDHVDKLNVEEEFLPAVVRALGFNIQLAVELEDEIGCHGSHQDNSVRSILSRGCIDRGYHDMSVLIDLLVFNLEKLLSADPVGTKNVLALWEDVSISIFTRLKLWLVGENTIFSYVEAGRHLTSLDRDMFWDFSNQEDLLNTLASRWGQLPAASISNLQKTILAGPDTYDGEESDKYQPRRAWRVLERIVWLANNGCKFSFDIDKERKKLIRLCPDWDDSNADNATDNCTRMRSGFVSTDKDCDQLKNIPLEQVINIAEADMGREHSFFVEKDPFSGLVAERPIRAFSVLVNNAKRGIYPVWAWQTFLGYDLRGNDRPRFSIAIANRLIQLPAKTIAGFIHAFSSWVEQYTKLLFDVSPEIFFALFDKHLEVFEVDISKAGSSITGGSPEPDWVSKAINSPVGKLASALFSDPALSELEPESAFPAEWLIRLEHLIYLEDNYGGYALVIISRTMSWFYAKDPQWTQEQLLSRLDTPVVGDAIWSGLLWSSSTPSTDLFEAIKPKFLDRVKNSSVSKRKDFQALAAFVLSGWLRKIKDSSSRVISSDETRELLLIVEDDFRSEIILVYERWLLGRDGKISEDMVDAAHEFFTFVWPKQIKIKSPTVSARLFDFAMFSLDKIEGITEMLIPLMQLNESARIRSSHFLNVDDQSVVQRYPEEFLKLLYAILSEEAKNWPYGVGKALPKVVEAKPGLAINPIYIELKRRWDSR